MMSIFKLYRIYRMSEDQLHFIEDLGRHMVGWGLPPTTGRTWGYLLLQPGPVSLDQIAGDLGVAKSGVSVATRQLVGFGLARVTGQRGSRRLLYEAVYDLDSVLATRNAQSRELVARLCAAARLTPKAARRERLEDMARVLQDLVDEMPELVRRIREKRRS
jgi:DNA-binding transcriptional regulator GbsR (MarR family)